MFGFYSYILLSVYLEVDPVKNFQKEVRFSVCQEGEKWKGEEFRFPIENFRFRSSIHSNTWGALVSHNKLYYHRGDDFPVIPGKLNLVSMFSGVIMASSLPNGDGASKWISTKDDISLVTSLELPYSNNAGQQVTTQNARLFGKDIAGAISLYPKEI